VNREQFIAWTQGILLERNSDGGCFAVNETKCEEAQKRLEQGEEIGFMINGELKSKIAMINNQYMEVLI
jgi:hypothetical protein